MKLLIISSILFFNICFSKSSISDNSSYKGVCLEASKHLGSFKKDPAYKTILEHLNYDQGLIFADYIIENYPHFCIEIDQFKINDSLGEPEIFNYKVFGDISPSTLRYIKILGDLEYFFGSLNGKKIIEIGGGYGGQAAVLQSRFSVEDYYLVDLPEVLKLQKKYLQTLHLKNHAVDYKRDSLTEYDLVISNYAFSELNKSVQDEYLSKIISKAKMGYMICNRISQRFDIESYSKIALVDKLESLGFQVSVYNEEPNTFEGNYLLIFQKKSS